MTRYFDLEVSLLGIRPRTWRRVRMRAEAPFSALHDAIQDSFGWGNYHLWEFRDEAHGEPLIAGLQSPDGTPWDEPAPKAEDVWLAHYFGRDPAPASCRYIYDFGDSWDHEVKLVGIADETEPFERRLVSGGRACPPEDCGGVDGYARMVQFTETGEDPWGDDVEELAEWLDGWRPEAFDLEQMRRRFDR